MLYILAFHLFIYSIELEAENNRTEMKKRQKRVKNNN